MSRRENGRAFRLGFQSRDSYYSHFFPKLDIPDGTYEVQNGKGYRVLWGGITQELPANHPLYSRAPEHIQLLYNLGMEFLTHYEPGHSSRLLPSRYAYFRNQELYLLGTPILTKEDPALILFLKREYEKQSISTSVHPYIPFDYPGAPLTEEGKIDVSFIRKYGVTVPEKMYLALGDNHAMSADSRQFGFVPQDNLKGGVSFLFSPPGPRWGRLPQPLHSHLIFPNLFVLTTACCIAVASSLYAKRRLEKPLRFS